MKPATVLIFSLFFSAALAADCKPLAQTTGAASFWKFFTDQFGPARFPEELKTCTGREYFFQVKGGAKMQSALDRKNGRILLRNQSLAALRHEIAHVYLDLRWRVLPYPVAEPLVLAVADPAKCATLPPATSTLAERWRQRQSLARCELLQLLGDVLNAPAPARDQLPLQ